MKLKRIYIKDFGIFRDEKLDDIFSQIVVIGGKNRAGKTTFMKLLRHLGFGFQGNDKEIPPPNVEYAVDYDIETKEGDIFNVSISGNKIPLVKGLNIDKDIQIEKLYGNIDYLTYKQLFTISLDELNNVSLKNSKEINSIQAIFLGAGFREIIEIPKIIKDMEKEAKKIGGKNGNPSTSQFKQYNKEIKEGIYRRERASQQLETYYKNYNELEKIENSIEKNKQKLNSIKNKAEFLEILKSNFNLHEELKALEIRLDNKELKNAAKTYDEGLMEKAIRLKEEYEDILQEYNNQRYEFRKNVGENEDIKDKLIKQKSKLQYCYNNISGTIEKINNYRELKTNCIKEKQEIVKEMFNINEEWKGDINKILSINTDSIRLEQLNNTINEYKEIFHESKLINSELENLKLNKDVFEKNALKNNTSNFNKILEKYFYFSLVIIACGILLSIINYSKYGVVFILSGAILGGVYTVIKYLLQNEKTNDKEDLLLQFNRANMQIEEKNKTIESINKKLEANEKRIQKYREILKLDDMVSGEIIKDYFKNVRELKNRISELEYDVKKSNNMLKEIQSKLILMYDLVKKFHEIIYLDDNVMKKSLIENSNKLFQQINILNNYIDISEEMSGIEQKKILVEENIYKLLGKQNKELESPYSLEKFIETNRKVKNYLELKTEYDILKKTLINTFNVPRVRKNLESLKEEYGWDINENGFSFKNLFEKYISVNEIDKEYINIRKKYENLKEEIEDLKDRLQNLKYELQVLGISENIESAQYKIDAARKGLEPIAKEYAVLRAAQFILEKIQNNFVEKTKHSLLKGAGEYLSFITAGEYSNILPYEDLTKLDFKLLLGNGNVQNTSEVLSRATKEQLFLSVRLSRIKEINPQLPIILDDSFVNFDEEHTKQTVKILKELSKTNQIFVTTCHPQLVQYIGKNLNNVQYLKLEKGKFEAADKTKLIEYLT
ncbi:AAA family ATPase [Clostridium aestuarii]|uniref:AAA family ATPase n=1 Tax=Clostridium aestuarii TaxID=338193 RepID=A0ABT4D068_9CLOT|nr:AAA family ATPase [Clostridium aestuarii]MCY6484634.1 AAA family ATPase [Clostridium aestuarii]